MKLDMHIRIPEAPVITRKKVRGHVYIYYEYDRTYDKEKRITYPKRASIGKLDADGLMVPNANIRKYLPGVHLPGERRVGTRQRMPARGGLLHHRANHFRLRNQGEALSLFQTEGGGVAARPGRLLHHQRGHRRPILSGLHVQPPHVHARHAEIQGFHCLQLP